MYAHDDDDDGYKIVIVHRRAPIFAVNNIITILRANELTRSILTPRERFATIHDTNILYNRNKYIYNVLNSFYS